MRTPLFEYGVFGFDAGLWCALIVGVAFGVTLEQAGLGNARKLAGQFYLRDFTVIKVLFTAIVTAMLGTFWLARAGVLDLGRVFVPETFLLPQLAGGAIFGVGFVLAGLCPGTSCVAAASGRTDGAFAMAGMFSGIIGAAVLLTPLREFYASTALGTLTLPDALGISYGVAVLGVVTMALIAFRVIAELERSP